MHWGLIFITTAILSCILGISIYLVDYKLTKNNVVSFSKKKPEFAFRTAESFLKDLNKTNDSNNIDLTKYKAGVRVYHKKFGEGIINYVEEEGKDLKVDITFDKAGHKRLMAKFAGLEII